MHINIPEREKSPSTTLYVNPLVKNKLGERPVVFILPGGPGYDSAYYQSYRCLFDIADIIFYDPRGCGQSNKSHPQSFTMDNNIQDIDIIRRTLNLDKVIILGKSYGSMVALGYAIQFGAHIDKLILAAGAPSYRFIEIAKRNLQAIGTPEQIRVCEKLWAGDFQTFEEFLEFTRLTRTLYSLKTRLEAQQPGFVLTIPEFTFSIDAGKLGFSDFLRKFDYEPMLSEIQCQTLILAGQGDWINDVSLAKLMAEKIPYNKLIIFENSGHAMEADVTEEYFSAIKAFI